MVNHVASILFWNIAINIFRDTQALSSLQLLSWPADGWFTGDVTPFEIRKKNITPR